MDRNLTFLSTCTKSQHKVLVKRSLPWYIVRSLVPWQKSFSCFTNQVPTPPVVEAVESRLTSSTYEYSLSSCLPADLAVTQKIRAASDYYASVIVK